MIISFFYTLKDII